MTVPVPEIRTFQPQIQPASAQPTGPQPNPAGSAIRQFLRGRGNSALADRSFHILMVLCALTIFGIVGLIAIVLILRSDMAWHQFGLKFFFTFERDRVTARLSIGIR